MAHSFRDSVRGQQALFLMARPQEKGVSWQGKAVTHGSQRPESKEDPRTSAPRSRTQDVAPEPRPCDPLLFARLPPVSPPPSNASPRHA